VQVVKQEEMKKKRDAYLDKLKKDKKFALNLAKPESPLVDVKFDGFPTKGKEGAKVTVVEFADFQCPHCKAASESFKKVTEKFKDKIKYVYLDFPINPSGISRVVAEGSHCADEQGKYWDYHFKAFEGQSTLDKESPMKLAKELKLDEAKFKTCLDGTKAKALVEKGRAEGDRIGVSGTPYLLINGRRYMGAHTVEAISKEIETSLK
jgi:protein-disulfide isomerase